MAQRDYAKRTTTRKPKAAVPGWVWMLIGLLVGLFIAFLVYLQQIGGGDALKKLTTSNSKPASTDTRAVKKTPTPEPPKKKEGISFDFYNILPELEVVIPEEFVGDVISNLTFRRGKILFMVIRAGGKVIEGRVPLAEMFGYSTSLRSKTQG